MDIERSLISTFLGKPFGAESRDEVRVVADQLGSPTYAPDIAVATIDIARNILREFRLTRSCAASFMLPEGERQAGPASLERFLRSWRHKCLRRPILTPISSAEYPTPAHRPANSRLNCAKLARVHGIELPSWRDSLGICLERLLS